MKHTQQVPLVTFALLLVSLACAIGQSTVSPVEAPKPGVPVFTRPLPTTSVPALLEPDFIPCTGESSDPPRDARPHSLGPWNGRIMTATSPDGLDWTRTNTIIADQADVPGAVVDSTGRVWLYYVTWCEAVRNQLVLAVSDDLQTWVYKRVHVSGVERGWADPVDPSVVLLDDGQFRLYFTSNSERSGNPRTYSAVSKDGINFALEPGVRFEAGGLVLDPNVLQVDKRWVFFAGGVASPGTNYFALSEDGLTFTAQDPFAKEYLMMANGLAMPGGYRYYAFEQSGPPGTPRYIRSLFSTDGLTWTVEPDNRLNPDQSSGLETNDVKDPSVVRLSDGSYLMFYVTGIPYLTTSSRSGDAKIKRGPGVCGKASKARHLSPLPE